MKPEIKYHYESTPATCIIEQCNWRHLGRISFYEWGNKTIDKIVDSATIAIFKVKPKTQK